tara:strand:- start:218 stop:802 length:585 start_codon:yes stop_codon:yes gene_type:complete
MKHKILLQVSLIITALVLSIMFYLKYFAQNKMVKNSEDYDNLKKEQTKSSTGNTVKEISYESNDNNGNNYIIKSDFGNFEDDEKERVYMTVVTARINLKNGKTIFLKSENAIYNTLNSDTNFFNEVELRYLNHKVNSNNLDISFKNNKLEAYNDLIYRNLDVSLLADKAEIDLITQNSKIYMFDNSQVKIIKEK